MERSGRTGSAWLLLGVAIASLVGCSRSAGPAAGSRSSSSGAGADLGSSRRELGQLIAEQLDAELQFSPTLATWLGDHTSDDRLDDVRLEGFARELGRLDSLSERLRRLGEQKEELGEAQRLELLLLAARVEAKRLELGDSRPLERSPIYYANLIAFGLDGLLGPNLLSLGGMRALRGRLAAVAGVCREAQRNLKNPPEIWTRRAIEVTQTTRDFVALLLPRVLATIALPDPAWPALVDDVNRQRELAERALEEFTGWLSRDLLPRSKGDWTLPRDRFVARLRALELLDVPLETVQSVAEFALRETKRRLDEVAHRLSGPGLSPQRAAAEALRAVEEDHPRPEELMRAAEQAIERAAELSTRQHFVTLPTQRPQVSELPAYRYGFIALSLPALLEPERPAQFYIDPVDQSWKDRKRIADHLRMLNRSQLLLSALHEVFPGHYTQQLAARQRGGALSPLRQRTLSLALLEGWSDAAEQALALASESLPAVPLSAERLQFLALRLELLRLGRLLGAIHLHASASPLMLAPAMTRLDDTVRMLIDDCYLDEYGARREAERLTYDPFASLGALGQLQLEQLRADAQAEQGSRFRQLTFHDALLGHGALPIVALRRLLLTQPGPSLRPPPEPPPAPLIDPR